MNKTVLLNEIIRSYPISRAKLSEVTGLNKSTVSAQIGALLNEELIFEIGQGDSSGGRRPVMLVFNQQAGFTIGVDLGVKAINAVLTDLKGNVVESLTTEWAEADQEAEPKVRAAIDALLGKMPSSPYGLIGIGVSVPGLINREQQVIFVPNLRPDVTSLKHDLENRYDVPVNLENEANAGAYGERRFGAGKDHEEMVFVSLGTGVGTGIILHGELYRGEDGFAGEFGHMSIEYNGPKCTCGNRGCWELYASEKVLWDKYLPGHTVETLQRSLQANEASVLNELQKWCFYVGVGLNTVLNVYNPKVIIIQSRVIELHPMVLNMIRTAISSRVYAQADHSFELFPSKLSDHASAIGMASLAIEQFLQRRMMQ
ncbi:ROK family transcriptional regulator [Exiguobacterium aurantiacum]|uniref:ROK family protein n=1 Tax=Exiguobacterium aurantiacum TaxID=33987 RepID=A0ABY5FS52_9BACL|nr:ROK family transcriptional regulator [Exiguobacterium aurantiacum]UTT44442.1 ROK family protein [Exiguobacterium aurantiacum]